MYNIAERYFRRNLILLTIDYSSFAVGMAFMGLTTILPSLVRQLGGSPVTVGAVGVIQAGGWYLPQLFMGRHVANRPLVKKYVLWPAVASRFFLGLAVAALSLLGVRAPRLALVAFLLAFAGFAIADAMGGVGWFDLLAKAIPIDRRGRAMGAAQSLASLAGIGVGVVVRLVLERPVAFPGNHVLLLLLAVVFTSISPMALALMREPRGTGQGEAQPPWREYLPQLARILRRNARFAWLTIAGWVAALADMGGAFYVLYAADRLHLPQATIGLFISAGVVGGLLCGLVLGPLGDRKGSATVITVTMVLRCLCPSLALLSPWLASIRPWLASATFLLIFGLLGMIGGSFLIGFANYLLEIAPPAERPAYFGLSNTLGIAVMLAPMFAGWLVQETSYELLFVVTLCLAVLGLGVALRRPARRVQPAPGAA